MRTIKCVAISVLLLTASVQMALAGEVAKIKIGNLAFTPAEITLRVGDTVEWVNDDFIDHTATANDGDWDVTVLAGKSARLQLTAAGTFEYFCRFHPNMTAAIHVSAN
jgi:plastocyanin